MTSGGANPQGYIAPGFEPVAEEFERNFSERGELGAAFAAVHAGELVVDLWGGTANSATGQRWARDTLQLVFSGTKGLVAASVLLLIDRGELELGAPVATYWPEFAASSKGEVTVADVVTHRARLPGIVRAVKVEEVTDDRRMARLLAEQPQSSDPRGLNTYHAFTFGWLCGELVRRIDGRTIGRFLAEEIADPLGLDLYLGVPSAQVRRVSRLELADSWCSSPVYVSAAESGDDLLRSVWGNPPVFSEAVFPWNSPAFHAAEIPAVNAVATARSMARFYGGLEELVSEKTLLLGRLERERRHEPLLDVEHAFGVGFQLQTELRHFGPPEDAFGHGGAGGSIHGAWPSLKTAFSYAMNQLRDEAVDPRSNALLTALHSCIT